LEAPAPPAAPAVNQAWLFQRLRRQLLHNTLRVFLRTSPLRLFLIFLFSALIWGIVFAASAEGFRVFRQNQVPLAFGIVGTLFDLLFLALTLLLIVSTGIILYSSLFSAAESAFLLATPARSDQVFAYKYQGALAFSSWGFFLLASPVLLTYGLAYGAPWYYYVLLPFFILGFVLIPGSLGALLCFVVVNFLPRRPKQVVVAALVLAFVGLILWLQRIKPTTLPEALSRDFVQRLLEQFAVAQAPLSPNHWMTRGLQGAARGDLGISGYSLALVWSNGLFLYVLTAWVAARLYRRGFNRVATGGMLRKRYGGAWLDAALTGLVAFLDTQTRLLIIKDFRTFRRDPAQWAQVLIFSGLMVLYFTNMRRFYQEELGRPFQNAVSLINLAATALLLCAYTGRFIYPMLSLEGRKFWILGLLPLHRDRLLWGKFAFAATWALLIAESLVVFSDLMLGMPWLIVGMHALTIAVLALGLSGLSVGLGAWIPNFRETDPSKIAVGFGGTLNLVTGLLLLILVIGVMAVPLHLWVWPNWLLGQEGVEWSPAVVGWLAGGAVLGVALGAIAVLVPLRIGARALRRMEF
jgi:ABC-2 type transport system permease protein